MKLVLTVGSDGKPDKEVLGRNAAVKLMLERAQHEQEAIERKQVAAAEVVRADDAVLSA